jgi:cob(I)alamin adenosyltransferase
MARISTGTGDDGTTGLVGGKRVPKTARRVEAYGTVDETNDVLGLALSLSSRPELHEVVRAIQTDLFTLGADLAAPPGVQTLRITAEHVARLEAVEDRLEAALPPLTKFILPGGTQVASFLQLARSVARRAEREAWRLRADGEDVNAEALRYLNRLSDLLFLLAREENHLVGREETQWMGRSGAAAQK